ncbi:glycoside hydrolase family 26 protein [Dietzia maris]|jgi:hypothetical protein|uniref:glycoside hydrolase family 26 protein n=2 Tax=Dietzia TaxID=37914 RepID=UPI00233031D1|nr:glycosyl hydrolase [Dietzia maris]
MLDEMRALRFLLISVMAAVVCTACGQRSDCVVEKASMTVAGEACPRFGVSTPGGPDAGAEYAAVTAAAGQAPAVELWFVDFTAPPPIGALEAVRTRGAEPIVTWEPWRALDDGEYDRSAYPMDEIAAGVHDDYLYRWADELRTWGGTVYLRFAHEPNGDWYPWSPAGGTGPETYVAAWQHIHDLFTLKQAHNVKWIWTVNVPHEGSSPIGPLYPGDDYVDVVGVDGYNWGTSQPWSRWQSPEEVFGPTLEEVADLAPGRPVAITEVASATEGGSKSEWIRDLVNYVDNYPDVTAFVWFDHLKEADWRVTDSAESATALATALRRERGTR